MHPPSKTEPYAVTIQGAIAYSGLSRSGLYRELSAGRLEARKIGRRTLILVDSLRAYVESLPEATFSAPRG